MNIVWITDNKFRELYGLYDLKEKLKRTNIKNQISMSVNFKNHYINSFWVI